MRFAHLSNYFILYVNTLAYRDFSENQHCFLSTAPFLMTHPRPITEFSTVPSIWQPLEITEFFTSAVLKYWVGQGIIGTCIDWPVYMEKFLSWLVIKESHVCSIVTWEVCNACKESLVCNAADVQSFAFIIQDVCQCIHGRKILGFFVRLWKALFS